MRTTSSRDRGDGPPVAGLVILGLSALALLATGAPIPTLEERPVGQVTIAGGDVIEHQLRIHLDPRARMPTRGSLVLTFQDATGLAPGDADGVALAIGGVGRPGGPASLDLPLDRCTEGCDLAYPYTISARPGVLPGSIVRFEADVKFEFSSGGYPDRSLLQVQLDDPATGPVAPIWTGVAGILALIAGIAGGPSVAGRLTERARSWPARALAGLPVLALVWLIVTGIIRVLPYLQPADIARSPLGLLFIVDPWSVVLLLTLAWGVRRGIRRLPDDGGWLLGVAAVAVVGLGGLWLAWVATSGSTWQPIIASIPFVVLGMLGGAVIAEAWRTADGARHDRSWAGLAVLGHGIVIAGFGYLAMVSLYDPFGSPGSLVALVPAALVAIAFRRWFGGRSAWLILFDLIVAVIGVLGGWFLLSGGIAFRSEPHRFGMDELGVLLAVGAAIVALATSLIQVRRPTGPPPAPPAPVPGPAGGGVNPPAPADDAPATT